MRNYIKLALEDPKRIKKSLMSRFLIIFGKLFSDKLYTEWVYYIVFGKKLDLKNPKTFNEKIQWIKIYDRKPEHTMMADKYEVRKYIAEKIGEEYLVPLLGVWDRVEDIDFEKLPEQFVLKCNHDCGSAVICKDKSKLDIEKTKKKLSKCLSVNYYNYCREWAYKDIKPRIIAEKYLDDGKNEVPEDYKIYCFNGKPEFIVVFFDRFNRNVKKSEAVYNTKWEWQPFSFDEHFGINKKGKEKPENLDELLKIANVLCKDHYLVRLDFYIVNKRIYFGEITLYTAGGLAHTEPKEYDEIIGTMINLPEENKK